MGKLSGIELIAKERDEQIEKHKRTVEMDVVLNPDYQLSEAAQKLLDFAPDVPTYFEPKGWNGEQWQYLVEKSFKERLIIAGALIAAEIDRIQAAQ